MERDKLNKTISKRPTGVFYIDGNKSFFFEQSLTSPIPLNIGQDILSNMEVINRKNLEALIQTFIRNYKLAPKNIMILLSAQLTFDRDFPQGSVEVEKNIGEFLELVPFDEVISKKILSSGKTRIVAANKELCDAIKGTFVAAGFFVYGVYPLSLCMESMPQLQANLDLNLVVSKVPDMKEYNLVPVLEASSITAQEKEKPNRTRMIMLLGVFGFLILILIFVVYKNILAPQKKPETDKLPEPSVAPAPQTSSPVIPAAESNVVNSSTTSGVNIVTPVPTTGQN